jgi:uncharacterized protein
MSDFYRPEQKDAGVSTARRVAMKRMSVSFEIKELDDSDDSNFVFEGYASTYGNVDRGDDVIERGAFDKSVSAMRDGSLKVLWQHNHDMPIGVFTEIRSDDRGLYVKGVLPKDDDFVRGRVIPQMRIKSVDSMSIGYITRDFEYDGKVRRLKEVDLIEVSLVTIPMNTSAVVTGFKGAVAFQDLPIADRETSWKADDAVARVKDATKSADAPSDKYKRAFLWRDPENEDDFEAYKFQIADVVDGKMTTIPRAVFAAAAAIASAKGADIPDDERATVIGAIERYYEKMGMDSPFCERMCFRVDDLSSLTERDTERLLRSGVILGKTSAKTMIAAIKSLTRDVEGEARDAKAEILSELRLASKALAYTQS